MEKIETAYWVETRTSYGPHEFSFSMETWVRLNPPARAWRSTIGNEWSHDVVDERGHLHMASTWDNCMLMPTPRPYTTESVLAEALLPPDMSQWKSEPEESDGQTLTRFEKEYPEGTFRVNVTIWANPETRRIVRMERRETDPETERPVVFEVRDRYTYNEEAPEGTFDMPPGKPVVPLDLSGFMADAWPSLPPEEQRGIQEAINRSDAAWMRADFREFSSAWRFDYLPRLPPKADWRKRVEKQRGIWNRWESQVESARADSPVSVRIATSAFAMLGERKALMVKTMLRVTWAEDSDTWEGHAEYFLMRSRKGYRIVHWDCPWEEIRAAHAGTWQEGR
jgi:hypothetical protein